MRKKGHQVFSSNNCWINSDLLILKGSKNWLLVVSPTWISKISLVLTRFPTAQQSLKEAVFQKCVGNYLGVLGGVLLQKVSKLSAKSVYLSALVLKWCLGKFAIPDVWYFYAESLPVLKSNWTLVITRWAESSRVSLCHLRPDKSCCTLLPLP